MGAAPPKVPITFRRGPRAPKPLWVINLLCSRFFNHCTSKIKNSDVSSRKQSIKRCKLDIK